ncbi:hypothetical protein ACFFRR_005769 [Megaselia abdita]
MLFLSLLIITFINFWTITAIDEYTNEVPKPLLIKQFPHYIHHKPRKIATVKKRPALLEKTLNIAGKEGINFANKIYNEIEPNILKNQQILDKNHPAALLSKFSSPSYDNTNITKSAYAVLFATKAFRKRFKINNELGRQSDINDKITFRQTALEGLCPPREQPICLPASERFRTHDGTCNNKRRPRWGSSQMPFNRFLPPQYGDGVDSIRTSVEGGPLSSSRFVSLVVHGAKESDAPVTLMLAQFGQLIDHDITATLQPRSLNGSVPRCCGPNDFHPSCFPIKVPFDDPWLAPLKIQCLEFLRSAPAQRRDCMLSWREQTNQATAYIDASPLYSSSARASDLARVFRNGLMVYGKGDPKLDVCLRGAVGHQCIRSGDGRSGEQPGLLALHHVWVGEHNRIATDLSSLNPHWSDEKIYQETRKIIGALFQHITYREFLPIVLGREVSKLFDLELLQTGYFDGYDPQINPTIANSFSAAAFRFGHSLVKGTYLRCDRNHNFINNNVTLHEEFLHGDIGTPGSLHRLLRGLSSQRALKRDEFITPELTNHLFQTEGFPFGLDLAAINIQRGRDHGIPSYTSWREPCGLSPVENWDDLSKVVGAESARRIGFAYKSVHDIDLFVGGISERNIEKGIVGPTFACIIAQQFSNLRKGDRFWYENANLPNSFTLSQLNSIRRVSFSQILCRSIGGGTLQPHIFLPHDVKGNERVLCGLGALAPINLRPWIDSSLLENKELSSTLSNVTFQTTTISPLFDLSSQIKKNISIDVIPNGGVGLHKPNKHKNTISDKLDFQSKILSKTSPIDSVQSTTSKPFIINNVSVNLHKTEISSLLRPSQKSYRKQRSVPNTSTIKSQTKQFSKDFVIPHKITFDAPESNQYEIEINIKPTSKGSQQHENRPNNFKNYISQNYASFNDYKKNTQRTKPPTVIYLDDQNESTRTPGILQNIFNFGQKTTKAPNKLDNIQSYFLNSPEVSFNTNTQNSNPHSHTHSDIDKYQDSNSVFSFTIRPNSKPNNYYSTLPRPETPNAPLYPDKFSANFGQNSPISSTRPIYSPQQTYNYYYFNRGPFYTSRPEEDYSYPQRNEKYNDLGRSELDIAEDEIDTSTIHNDYDYYDYETSFNKTFDVNLGDELELSQQVSMIQDRNISVNDNFVLPVINITKTIIQFTTMPKNSNTNIYSNDYDYNNYELTEDSQSSQSVFDKRYISV